MRRDLTSPPGLPVPTLGIRRTIMEETRHRRLIAVGPAIVGLALAAGCASTNMSSTWTDPSARGAELSKVAVVCLTRDAGLRRMAEESAASQLAGAQAVPSYQVLGDTKLNDREAVKSRLTSAGFHNVLVMRLAGVTQQVTPTTGMYGTFNGGYDAAGASMYAPGY